MISVKHRVEVLTNFAVKSLMSMLLIGSSTAWKCNQAECEKIQRETCAQWHPSFVKKMEESVKREAAKEARIAQLDKQLADCVDRSGKIRHDETHEVLTLKSKLDMCDSERKDVTNQLKAQREAYDKLVAATHSGQQCQSIRELACDSSPSGNPKLVAATYEYVMRQYVPSTRGCNRNRHLSSVFRQFMLPKNHEDARIFLASLQHEEDPYKFYEFYSAVKLIKSELDALDEVDFFADPMFDSTTTTAATETVTEPETTVTVTTTTTTASEADSSTTDTIFSPELRELDIEVPPRFSRSVSAKVALKGPCAGYTLAHMAIAFCIWPTMIMLYYAGVLICCQIRKQ